MSGPKSQELHPPSRLVWMESHSTCCCTQPESPGTLLPIGYTHPQAIPQWFTPATLWQQQKLPPSPPVRAYTHTHTHIHTSRTAGGQSRINAGKGQGQKPSSLTSMQDRSYGTVLFLRSVLDLGEATQPLKPHPCSSPFLLLPNRASLILFNIQKNSLFKSLTHESHFRFCF